MTSTSRYVLHVGLPKTGTSYLQAVLKAHRSALESAGVLYPRFGKRGRFLAALDARDLHEYAGVHHRADGHWRRFVESTGKFDGTVLFSHEVFGAPTSSEPPTALRELAGQDTHVVVTARDPGRQLISTWQQRLRFRSTRTFDEYLDHCDFEPQARYRHSRFRNQHLDSVLRAWAQFLPADHVHVVVVPPRGTPVSVLWARFCTAIGVDADRFAPPDLPVVNPSLGVAQSEYLRRMNAALGDGLEPAEHAMVRKLLVHTLGHTERSPAPALPDRAYDTATMLADRWIGAVRAGGYDVVGDLDDLRPVRGTGPGPGDWDEGALATIGTATSVSLLTQLARLRGPQADDAD